MAQGGGGYQVIDGTHSQMSRGEDLADTARAISAMCDAVVIRTVAHADIQTFAKHRPMSGYKRAERPRTPVPDNGRHSQL